MTADPTLPAPGPGDWWRNAVVYQIYPRSFADGSGDGIGDLPGITSRLDALAELGIDAVWLSPFYRSPQADAGYDVADYRDVDPLFGTLADFDALLAKAHLLGLKVIIDLVPNHSSDEHPWFTAARAAAPGSPERARYIFRDGNGPDGAQPPNNWLSIFGGIGWTRVTEADGRPGQWYLHMFDVKQPDWDWTNEEVREEFRSVLRFWLDRGVDGFRVDVANSLIKRDGLPDYDPSEETGGVMAFGTPDGDALVGNLHTSAAPMWDQDGVHEIYRDWRLILDKYSPARILVAEAWVQPLSRLGRYVRPDEMHQAFNFEYLSCPWDPAKLRQVISASLAANRSVGAPTTWVLSNHDVLRHPTRFGLADQSMRPNGIGPDDPQPDVALGLRRGRAATLTMLALPGSAYLYQGEELGLPEHTGLDDNLREDPTWMRSGQTIRGRDGCRVPLPWEADRPGLGFSPTGATWLPQPESYVGMSRDVEGADPDSTLQMYRTALRLRREHGLGDGDVEWVDAGDDVVAFRNLGVVVLSNMGTRAVPLPAGDVLLASGPLPGDGTLPVDTTIWLG
jgi:alpha-glucosidase